MKKYKDTIAIILFLLLISSVPVFAQESAKETEIENVTYNPLEGLPKDEQPQETVNIVLSQDWIITEEQGLVTLSQQFASLKPAEIEGMLGYPGYTQSIIINTNGYRIIIKNGGALSLQEYNADSVLLSIQGEQSESLFYVERGGTLNLSQVLIKSEGIAVEAEAGAKYSWTCSDKEYPEPTVKAPPGMIAIEPASGVRMEPLRVYDNMVWSDSLPTEHLPELSVLCSVDGVIENLPRKLKVVWNTEQRKHELLERQDCILEGCFVDENDAPIESCFVPTLSVCFLQRSPVKILSADLIHNGSGTYHVEIQFEIPTDYVNIFLEVSEDSGQNWEEIASLENGIMHRGGMAYAVVPDNQIRHYRILVEGGPNEGYSQIVQLPKEEISKPDKEEDNGNNEDNSGNRDEVDGNRGGGTAVNPPDRELPEELQDEAGEITTVPETDPESAGDEENSNSIESGLETSRESTEIESETEEIEQSPKEDSVFEVEIQQQAQIEDLKQEAEELHKTEITEGNLDDLSEKQNLSVGSQAVAAVLGVAGCGMVTGIVCSPVLRSGIWRLIRRVFGR